MKNTGAQMLYELWNFSLHLQGYQNNSPIHDSCVSYSIDTKCSRFDEEKIYGKFYVHISVESYWFSWKIMTR